MQLVAMGDLKGERGSLSLQVYTALRAAILDLRLMPGAVLRKGVLCETLGVSRSPVAEAVTRLSTEGLVDVVPQSATRVSRLSMEDIREQAFIRDAIETSAAAMVAAERTEEQLARLSRHVRLQQLLIEDGDFFGFFMADEDFHRDILDFTGFSTIAEVSQRQSLQVRRARMLLPPTEARARQSLAEHEAVVSAIRARRVEDAAKAMRVHLGHLFRRLEPLELRHPEFFRSRRR